MGAERAGPRACAFLDAGVTYQREIVEVRAYLSCGCGVVLRVAWCASPCMGRAEMQPAVGDVLFILRVRIGRDLVA